MEQVETAEAVEAVEKGRNLVDLTERRGLRTLTASGDVVGGVA